MTCRATMAARSSDTMPVQSSCPMFEVSRVDRSLVAIEPDRVVPAAGVDPEVALEALAQRLGLAPQAGGQGGVGERAFGKLGQPELRVIDVTLDLGRRDRQERDRPVGEQDAVERIAPALVAEALGGARPVLDVAVAVSIPGLVDPGERRQSVVAQRADQLLVAGPAPVLGQQDQPQGRRVGAAVVRAVRLETELGELAHPQLVQDLARLHVPEVIVPVGLERGQGDQRPLGRGPGRTPRSGRR